MGHCDARHARIASDKVEIFVVLFKPANDKGVQGKSDSVTGAAGVLSRGGRQLHSRHSAMSAETRTVVPSVLSLMGGIFIVLGAVVASIFAFGSPTIVASMSSSMSGMMGGGMSGMMIGLMMGVYPIFSIIGFASGALVILGAVMLYNRPSESQIWSSLILAFSLLSILGAMGGFMVGLLMGVLGGIFGLVWKPATSTQMSDPHRPG